MEKADLYTRITNRIIAELEAGTRPWLKPWNAEHAAGRITRPLRHNGIAYRGINVITLWMTATARGYACPIWLTYKQAQELGAQVRKGEHGELVVYANRITRTETGEKGEETEREIPFLKGYTVFNAEQIDNRRLLGVGGGCAALSGGRIPRRPTPGSAPPLATGCLASSSPTRVLAIGGGAGLAWTCRPRRARSAP
jgi:hypothetical protein